VNTDFEYHEEQRLKPGDDETDAAAAHAAADSRA
jgi:hypothetical protein